MPVKGVYTSELYVVVGSIVALLTAAINKNLPPTYAAIAVSVLGVAYTGFRTWLKAQGPPTIVKVTPTVPPNKAA